MTPNKRNVIDNYNSKGKNYDNIRYGRVKGGRYFSEVELRKTLEQIKGSKVLQIGTATGRVSAHLVSSGFDYVGVELSEVMVRITKEKLGDAGDVIQADPEHLPFTADAFDDVVSVRSFHFLPHPEAFLDEAYRVLKRTGRGKGQLRKEFSRSRDFSQTHESAALECQENFLFESSSRPNDEKNKIRCCSRWERNKTSLASLLDIER